MKESKAEIQLLCLVRHALERGIDVGVVLTTCDGCGLGYELRGFYKSGTLKLFATIEHGSPVIIAEARYHEQSRIFSWDEIVHINYDWWVRTRDRHEGWNTPDAGFLEDFERLGLVRTKTETKYEPATEGVVR